MPCSNTTISDVAHVCDLLGHAAKLRAWMARRKNSRFPYKLQIGSQLVPSKLTTAGSYVMTRDWMPNAQTVRRSDRQIFQCLVVLVVRRCAGDLA